MQANSVAGHELCRLPRSCVAGARGKVAQRRDVCRRRASAIAAMEGVDITMTTIAMRLISRVPRCDSVVASCACLDLQN